MYQLIAVAVALGIAFTAGWKVKAWQDDSAKLAAKNAVAEAKDKFEEWSSSRFATLEDKLGKLRVINTTVNKEVQREILTNTVYTNPDCGLPSAYRLLNSARGWGRTSEGAGERFGPVPATPAVPRGEAERKDAPW